jgi:hypothetical protein
MNDPHRPMPTPSRPHQPPRGVPHAAPPAPRPSMAPPPGSNRPGIAPMPVQPTRSSEADLDPIALVEEELEEISSTGTGSTPMQSSPAAIKSKIRAFTNDTARREHNWKRAPYVSGHGAIRVKSFHGKYSDQGVEHLDDMINEWIDAHPDVEVKFVTSTVHVFEGKIREPALVMNVWY